MAALRVNSGTTPADVVRNHHADRKCRASIGIVLTVQSGRSFMESIAQGTSIFEAITAFLIVLSVGILVAHALDAFRPWT
jgi:hypothetical protein